MATKQSTADYLLDQLSQAGDVFVRKMFGEYALYCDGKVVSLICDDTFFIKPTPAGEAFICEVEYGHPYPGSSLYVKVPDEKWDDRDWLCMLVRTTADALPAPKPKKKKISNH